MIRTYFFIFATLAAETISAQEVFQRSYGGYGSDYGRAVIECSDGGYLVVGSTNSFVNASTDVYLLRVDEAGDYLWGKNIGLSDYIEWGVDLVEDTNGNFILAGYTDSTSSGTYAGLLIKTNHTGNVLWQKSYGGDDWAFFSSMDLTDEGNIIIAGQKTVDGNPEGWIIMTDLDGVIIWETLIPGNGKVSLTGVDICSSGVIVFTGYTENTLLDTKTQVSGSLNMNGAIIWAATYPEFGKVETGKCVCGIEDQLFIPATFIINQDSTDIMVTTINSVTGNVNWSKKLNLSRAVANSIAQKENGNVYFVGAIYGIGFSNYSASVNSYSMNGFDLPPGNTAIVGGNGIDILYDIKPTSDNGLIATGETSSFGNNFQVHLCKIDSNGIYNNLNTDYLDTTTKIQSATKLTPFSIFPNPAKSTIEVELEIKEGAAYEIIDLTGKTLSSGSIHSASKTLDIGDLKAGFYFIRIETGEGENFLSRFVKID